MGRKGVVVALVAFAAAVAVLSALRANAHHHNPLSTAPAIAAARPRPARFSPIIRRRARA